VKKNAAEGVMSDAERMKLVSTEQSLSMEPEPRLPSGMAGLENFKLGSGRPEERRSPEAAKADAESLFNLPADEDDEDDNRR
jgi:hypothetical protein